MGDDLFKDEAPGDKVMKEVVIDARDFSPLDDIDVVNLFYEVASRVADQSFPSVICEVLGKTMEETPLYFKIRGGATHNEVREIDNVDFIAKALRMSNAMRVIDQKVCRLSEKYPSDLEEGNYYCVFNKKPVMFLEIEDNNGDRWNNYKVSLCGNKKRKLSHRIDFGSKPPSPSNRPKAIVLSLSGPSTADAQPLREAYYTIREKYVKQKRCNILEEIE